MASEYVPSLFTCCNMFLRNQNVKWCIVETFLMKTGRYYHNGVRTKQYFCSPIDTLLRKLRSKGANIIMQGCVAH